MALVDAELIERLKIYFPKSRGKPRVDDQKVLGGITCVIRNGLRWKDLPKEYGPYKTVYNRFIRWSRRGIFTKIFQALADEELEKMAKNRMQILVMDSTHLKVHRTAASLQKKGLCRDTLNAQKAD
ncbi:MAG: transposase [Puniceicoccales bacterium]|jgi:transposase|nr:transposase [Puniceicoccales bacterium]